MLPSDWWSYKLAPVLKVVDLMKSIWVMGERAWNSTNLTQPKTFSSTLFWASSPTIWRFLWHPHQYFGQISVALSHFDNIFLSLHQYKEISTYSIISQQIWLDFGQIWQNIIWFLQTWHLISIQWGLIWWVGGRFHSPPPEVVGLNPNWA